jgi:hypothetical protein
MKRLDPATEKFLQNLYVRQSALQQSPNGLLQGLQPTEVHLRHTVPLVGMGDRASTCERGERHVGGVPQ